jgi:hypothetical protein
LRELPAETAAEVLRTELRRLDALFSAYYDNGVSGDMPAASMALRVADQRAKLLGLYPKDGQQQTLGVTVKSGDAAAPDAIEIQFVFPGPRSLDDELLEHRPQRDVTPPQRATAPPTIDATVNPEVLSDRHRRGLDAVGALGRQDERAEQPAVTRICDEAL